MRFGNATGRGVIAIYDAMCFIECGTFTISPYFVSFWGSSSTGTPQPRNWRPITPGSYFETSPAEALEIDFELSTSRGQVFQVIQSPTDIHAEASPQFADPWNSIPVKAPFEKPST